MARGPDEFVAGKLTHGGVGRRLLGLAVPMSIAFSTNTVVSIADMFFVGQLGTNELAAVSFSFPVTGIMFSLTIGLGVGASSVIARTIGSGNTERVRRLSTDSLILGLVIALILTALGLSTIDPLFRAVGATEEVLPLIHDFMEIWYLGMIFMVVPMIGNSTIRAQGEANIPAALMAAGAIIQIMLEPFLIFGLAGFPEMGLKGAPTSMVIARSMTFCATLWVLHYHGRMIVLRRPKLREVWESWKAVLHVGLPSSATNLIGPVSGMIVLWLLARYGKEVVAGYGVAMRIESLLMICLIAVSSSMGPFMGQNWGARKYDRVERAIKLASGFCLGWGIFSAIVLGLFGPYFSHFFDQNPDVIATSTLMLLIVPISFGPMGVIMVASSTFNALGKPFPSATMTLLRMLVLYVPFAFLGDYLWGVAGIFWSNVASNAIIGVLAWWWIRRTIRAEMAEVGEAAQERHDEPAADLAD